MKKILILGGASYQVPLIKAAKKCGYNVILCDYTTTNPGIPLADKHYQVSTLDYPAVLDVAKKEKVHGVISNSEPAMMNVALIAKQLGLVGNPPEAIRSLMSKKLFREAQKESGLFSPNAIRINDFAQFESEAGNLCYPLIFKPTQNSGTRGTTVIYKDTSIQEAREAFQVCSDFSRDRSVTIEEYIAMPSLNVIEGDLFVNDGQILWKGLFVTGRSSQSPMIPMTYILPPSLTDSQICTIKEQVTRLFQHIGIRHGQYNIEMYFTKENKLFIIEVNPRQGGNNIPRLIQLYSGIDYNNLLVSTAMGEGGDEFKQSIEKTVEEKFLALHLVFSHQKGIYDGMVIDKTIMPFVKEVNMTVKSGDEVEGAYNATNKIGEILLEFSDAITQLRFCNQIEKYIYPRVKANGKCEF